MSDSTRDLFRIASYAVQLFLLGAVWLIAIHLLATYWYEAGWGRQADLDTVRGSIFDYRSALTAFVVAHFCLLPAQTGLWGKLRWLMAICLVGPAMHVLYYWGEFGGTVLGYKVRVFLYLVELVWIWLAVVILHALRGLPPNVGTRRVLLGYLGFAVWGFILKYAARFALRDGGGDRPAWIDFGEPLDGLLWLAAIAISCGLLFGWASHFLYRPRTIVTFLAFALLCAAISSVTFFYEEGRKPVSVILLQR